MRFTGIRLGGVYHFTFGIITRILHLLVWTALLTHLSAASVVNRHNHGTTSSAIGRLSSRDSATLNSTRDVYVQFHVNLTYYSRVANTIATSADTDYAELVQNTYVEIEGDKTSNGNLRLGIGLSAANGLAAFVEDLGVSNILPAPLSRFVGSDFIRSIQVGSTTLQNSDILDPTTGKGLIADLWSANNNYQVKGHSSLDFAFDALKKIGIDVSGSLQSVYDAFRQQVIASSEDFAAEKCPLIGTRQSGASGSSVTESWVYDVSGGTTPLLQDHFDSSSPPAERDFTTVQAITGTKDGVTRQFSAKSQINDFFQDQTPSEARFWVSLADMVSFRQEPLLGINGDSLSSSAATSAGQGGKDVVVEGSAELALVRNKGVFSVIRSVAASGLDVAGVAETALVPLFIIVDIIDGDWKAAVFAAVSPVAGILTGALISGPIGVFLGAALAAILDILPGIFHSPGIPSTNNPAQIIQNAFFGNPITTGNENCNEKRKAANLSQNCTALYGSGTISKVTRLDIFDVIIILSAFNNGFPMSILDLAAVMPVKDYTKQGWADDKPVYIDCGRSLAVQARQIGAYEGYSVTGDGNDETPEQGYKCPSATFHVNRSLIHLPGLNLTADEVYSRIIPAPGGDCKLLSDPADSVQIPYVNLVVTGRPVGIECNVTQNTGPVLNPDTNLTSSNALGANGTSQKQGTQLVWNVAAQSNVTTSSATNATQPAQNTTSKSSGNGNLTSPRTGIVSTEGTSSQALTPTAPPPTDFVRYNVTDSVCFSAPTQYLCLPNGTYETSTGDWGFNSVQVTALTLPSGASMNFSYPLSLDQKSDGIIGNPYAASAGDQDYTDQVAFYQSIAAGSTQQSNFQTKIKNLASSSKVFDLFVSNSPPGVCLFSDTKYKGNVQCFGPGGTNVSDYIGTQVQSLTIVGAAVAYLYSGSYGDATSKQLTQSVPDLSQVEDGTVFNFAKRVKAMWVRIPADPFNPSNGTIASPTTTMTQSSTTATNLSSPTVTAGNGTVPSQLVSVPSSNLSVSSLVNNNITSNQPTPFFTSRNTTIPFYNGINTTTPFNNDKNTTSNGTLCKRSDSNQKTSSFTLDSSLTGEVTLSADPQDSLYDSLWVHLGHQIDQMGSSSVDRVEVWPQEATNVDPELSAIFQMAPAQGAPDRSIDGQFFSDFVAKLRAAISEPDPSICEVGSVWAMLAWYQGFQGTITSPSGEAAYTFRFFWVQPNVLLSEKRDDVTFDNSDVNKIYRAKTSIMQKVTGNDLVIFLGNTASYFYYAFDPTKDGLDAHLIPYSGSPDFPPSSPDNNLDFQQKTSYTNYFLKPVFDPWNAAGGGRSKGGRLIIIDHYRSGRGVVGFNDLLDRAGLHDAWSDKTFLINLAYVGTTQEELMAFLGTKLETLLFLTIGDAHADLERLDLGYVGRLLPYFSKPLWVLEEAWTRLPNPDQEWSPGIIQMIKAGP